jgi:ferrous iron transport protein A
MSHSLDSLPTGTPARVTGFADLPAELFARLLELGFDEGVTVEKLHAAPFGDPLAVRVGAATVAVRRAVASAIRVA